MQTKGAPVQDVASLSAPIQLFTSVKTNLANVKIN